MKRYFKIEAARNFFVRFLIAGTTVVGIAVVRAYGIAASLFRRKAFCLDRESPHRVLLIKLWSLGEVCMVTPVAVNLKNSFPKASLSVLVGKNFADIFKNSPHVDEIIGVDERVFLHFKPAGILDLAKRLKAQRFDAAVVLHHFVLFSIFAWLIGAKARAGFDRNGEGFLNTIRVKPSPRKHKIDEYLSVAEAMGATIKDGAIRLFPTPQDDAFVDGFLAREGVTKEDTLIGIMPTGGKNTAADKMGAMLERKCWPLERYAGLSKMLTERLNAKVVVLGGRNETEKAIEIRSAAGARAIDATDRLNLRQLTSMARRCAVIVTNDSGPMHAAAASGTPMVVIFGPTNPSVCGPVSDNARVIYKRFGCSPCFHGEVFPNTVSDCQRDEACMKSVAPEEVFEAVKAQLGKRKDLQCAPA